VSSQDQQPLPHCSPSRRYREKTILDETDLKRVILDLEGQIG
jgi:hypothetical protein